MDKNIFYNDDVLNKNRLRETWCIKNLKEYDDIVGFKSLFTYDVKFSQVLFHYINNLNDIPLCINCEINNKRFDGFDIGYNSYCSKKCAINYVKDQTAEVRRVNTLNKYGVEHTSKLKSVKEKQRNTNVQKYGFVSPTNNKEIWNKQRTSMVEKYGVEYCGESKDLLQKALDSRFDTYKKTIYEKYSDLNIVEIVKENEIVIHCDKCDENYTITSSMLYQRKNVYDIELCLVCNPHSSYKFSAENEILNYLEDNGISYVRNDRSILDGKEIDILIPSKNIGLEFNGLYWHSSLYKDSKYHLNKTELASKKSIKLIHIWEDDFVLKKDIIYSRINNLLGLNNNKIYARKCDIRIVDNKESKKFIDENHLQGNINSNIKIGLYYENQLISIISFGKLRRSLGSKSIDGEFELYRFCSKLNYNVIGGFQRLLKYFEDNYNPSKIITYANRDWSSETNIYLSSGFTSDGCTSPNFWYFNNENIRRHRFQFRKDRLLKKGYIGSTANEIMINLGYNKIYDTGSYRYYKIFK